MTIVCRGLSFGTDRFVFLERVEETLLHFKTKLFEGGIQPLEVGNEQGS